MLGTASRSASSAWSRRSSGREVQGPHRLDVADELAPRGVGRRRDVDDHEPLDQLGVPQREHHRDLAAHRVPDQRHRPLVPQRLGHPVGQVEVVERLGPRRAAVVGHVDQQHPVVAAEVLGDLGPVLALPEEAVAEGDDRPVVAEAGHVQCGGAHRASLSASGDDPTHATTAQEWYDATRARIAATGYRPAPWSGLADLAVRRRARAAGPRAAGRRAPAGRRRRGRLLHLRGGRRVTAATTSSGATTWPCSAQPREDVALPFKAFLMPRRHADLSDLEPREAGADGRAAWSCSSAP